MVTKFYITMCLSAGLCLALGVAAAHPADENPALTLPEYTQQFRQDRFGMFIHWGVYSELCDGESVMKDREISAADYERTAQFFNPASFDATEWVTLAKSAGMRYITFTAKSRDGFAMWDSSVSPWNVVDATPFGRDVIRELGAECERQGIKLFVYYSPIDWRKSAIEGVDDNIGTTTSLGYAQGQLRELFTNYDNIHGLWLDGWWDSPDAGAQMQSTYNLVHSLQPAALIGNHGGDAAVDGVDFITYDHGLPAESIAGSSNTLNYRKQPLEVRDTINESWGYRITDNEYKSARELVHRLVRAAGVDANFLLNVAPMPNGRIQQEFTDRLQRMGMWLAKNGESVYSTRGGPVLPQPWGVTTHRHRKIYVHVLDEKTTSVELKLPATLRSARYYNDESDVPFTATEGKVVLKLRPERRGEMERLILLETR